MRLGRREVEQDLATLLEADRQQDHARDDDDDALQFQRMSLSTSSSSSSSSSSASAKRVNFMASRAPPRTRIMRTRARAPRRRPGRARARARFGALHRSSAARSSRAVGGRRGQPAWRGSWRVANSGTRSLRQRLAAQRAYYVSSGPRVRLGQRRGGNGARAVPGLGKA